MSPGDDRPATDHYKTLQVDPEADPEVIQAAYRRLARKYHPDVMSGPEAAERMIAINRAWEQLGDPARRAAYDAERLRARDRAAQGRATSGVPGSPPARTGAAGQGTDGPPRTSDGARGAGGEPTAAGGGPRTAGGGPRTDGGGPRTDGGGSARSGSDPRAGAGHPGGRPPADPPFESVSRDWTTGRSSTGSTYDPARMARPQGEGSAGPPPGAASGSVLNFGRYAGWSRGEIARVDLEYLEWLDRAPIGRAYRDEVDVILRRTGRRRSADSQASQRRGLFRRT